MYQKFKEHEEDMSQKIRNIKIMGQSKKKTNQALKANVVVLNKVTKNVDSHDTSSGSHDDDEQGDKGDDKDGT